MDLEDLLSNGQRKTLVRLAEADETGVVIAPPSPVRVRPAYL